MIRIDISTHSGCKLHLTARGHALYGEPGKDIVCAAASMLLQALIAWIQEIPALYAASEITWFAGDAVIDMTVPPDMEQLVSGAVGVFVTGCTLLEKKYPENVTVGAKYEKWSATMAIDTPDRR